MRSIQEERISQLNDKDVQDGDYVLYWMQEAQRASYNHALEYAAQRANELEQPLLVVFGLTADYPEATLSAVRQVSTSSIRSRFLSLGDRAAGRL
jgi:deoxyribodipyrimidine photolyase